MEMKRIRFSEVFLVAAIIIYAASRHNAYSSVILIMASIYMLVDVAYKIRKEWKNNGKKKS